MSIISVNFLFVVAALGLTQKSYSQAFNVSATPELLAVGNTAFVLTTQMGEVSNQFIEESNNEDATSINYAVKTRRTRLVPQWAYGILTGWTVGAKVPIVRSEVTKTYAHTGTHQNESNVTVGNVEVSSQERAYTTADRNILLLQRLSFPSEDRVGYAFGLGAALESFWSRNFKTAISLMYDLTFTDKLSREDENGRPINIKRNPGDEFTAQVSSDLKVFRNFSTGIGATWEKKFKDKWVAEVSKTMGEVRIAYKVPEADRFETAYYAEVNYQSTLLGTKSVDFDTVGLHLKMVY